MDEVNVHISYKVWLDIERSDEQTGEGDEMFIPMPPLASFDRFDEALDYTKQVTELASGINA